MLGELVEVALDLSGPSRFLRVGTAVTLAIALPATATLDATASNVTVETTAGSR